MIQEQEQAPGARQRKEAKVVDFGTALLRAGLLASNLPNRLMSDFGLPPRQAQRLSRRAIRQWQQSNQQD